MYHHDELIFFKFEIFCKSCIENFLYILNFNEMISSSQCSKLVAAFLYCVFWHCTGISGESAIFFDSVEVVGELVHGNIGRAERQLQNLENLRNEPDVASEEP